MLLAENTNEFQEDGVFYDPSIWDRLLEVMPEGSELILTPMGKVTGVILQIEIGFDSADDSKGCDNRISDRGNEIFERIRNDWVRLTKNP